ncbi:hypothetical protein ACOBQB_32995 [Streptomyces sp. G5(2025)]|uniref:hypothetical protein n=1 Tax=Streptomyces sp. G5(2025) TaxID=3406628 RepID=UPI003C23E694
MNDRPARRSRRSRWTRPTALCLAMGAAVGTLTSCGSRGEVTYAGGTLEEVGRAGTAADGGEEPASADEVRGRKLALKGMELFRTADTVRIGVAMDTEKGRQKVSLHMDRESNCTGTFDSGPTQRGDFIVIAGSAMYIRFTDGALDEIREQAARRGPEIANRVRERTALARGKYLKLPKGTATRGPATPMGSCDLDKLTAKIGSPEPGEVITARPTTHRYGTDVTPLSEKKDGEETTVYVAATGEPYILGVEARKSGGAFSDDQTMSMRVTDYDEPVVAVAPAAGLTVDISQVGPGGSGGSLFEV